MERCRDAEMMQYSLIKAETAEERNCSRLDPNGGGEVGKARWGKKKSDQIFSHHFL